MQHFLNEAHWYADTVRDDLREYVVVHLEDEIFSSHAKCCPNGAGLIVHSS